MDCKTRSNTTFSSWAVIHSANPSFDFEEGLRSAEAAAEQDTEDFEPPAEEETPASELPAQQEIEGSVQPSSVAQPSRLSRMDKLKAASRARNKRKRADVRQGRRSIPKKISLRYPEDGPSVSVKTVKDLDIEASAVVRTGYVALCEAPPPKRTYTLAEATGEGSELGFTLQRWNGTDPTLIVDKNGVVCAILAGRPNATDWERLNREAVDALESAREHCSIPPDGYGHRRGDFATLRCGVSHGGGQPHPMNLKNEPVDKAILEEFNEMECFKRAASFGSAVMMSRAPRLYDHYVDNLAELQGRDSRLKRPFPSTVFCAASYNLGPEMVCYEHKDGGNLTYGYCTITPYGFFDPSKGGHLILWECHLVIRFPPGSTVLLPSAVISHSNCSIQPGERRYSFAQYTAGAIFRWVNNQHMPAAKFLKSLSAEERKLEEEKDRNRWRQGLSLLPRVQKTVVETAVRGEEPEEPL